MKNFDLKKYLAEGKLLKEDINSILRDGGYDEIDDLDLLKTVEKEYREGMSAEDINDLTMRIEDREGGNIDFSENLLKEESIPSGWKKIDTSDEYEEEDEQGRLMGFEAPMNGIEGDEVDNIYIEQDEDEFEVHIMTAFNDPEYKGPFNSKEEALKVAIQKMQDLKKDWDSEEDYIGEGKLLKEDLETNSILMGYMLIWDGVPAKIHPPSEYDTPEEKADYIITYKNNIAKSDLKWLLFKDQKELQNRIDSLKGDVSVLSSDWRSTGKYTPVSDLYSNSFEITPVTLNW